MRPVPDQCKIFLSPAFIVGGRGQRLLNVEFGMRNAEFGMLLPITYSTEQRVAQAKG